MIRYPKYVQKDNNNNILAITAMSDGAKLEKIDYAINNIKKYGYGVIETPNVRKSFKLVSSDARTRVNELMELLKNNEVVYIISARGGEFAMEMLEYLEKEAKFFNSSKPKWIQGYSDNSLILYYLTTNYNIATIHASNINTYAMKNLHLSLLNTFNLVRGEVKEEFIQKNYDKYQIEELKEDPQNEFNLTEKVKYINLNKNNSKEEFSGRLIGGCIDVLSILLGTKYDNTINFCNQFKEEGMIWYIDNYGLDPTELYRKLWQMKECGWFNNTKGFLIGRTYAIKEVGGFTYEDALNKSIGKLNVPIIYDVDLGHTEPQFVIVNGSFSNFIYENGKGTLIQKLI